jgi:hypothetical protein
MLERRHGKSLKSQNDTHTGLFNIIENQFQLLQQLDQFIGPTNSAREKITHVAIRIMHSIDKL